MTGNRRATGRSSMGSDLAKVDAHQITPDEYDEAPELSDAQIAAATLHEAGRPVRRGRPRSAAPKEAVNIRLSADVLSHFRATGPGWQTRIDAALRAAMGEPSGQSAPASRRQDRS